MVALPSGFRFRARFSRLEAGRKRATATAFGVYRPHRQAVSTWKPPDSRCPGFLCPSTAGCRVVDLPAVSSPLLLLKPAACLPSFSNVQDCTAPCRPDVDVYLMFLAMKNRPVFVTWFLFANFGLTYNIQFSFQLSRQYFETPARTINPMVYINIGIM